MKRLKKILLVNWLNFQKQLIEVDDMFERLRSLLPALIPMRMGAEEVERYHTHGLGRSEEYFQRLREALTAGAFSMFEASIQSILKYRVTIEQEVFLL